MQSLMRKMALRADTAVTAAAMKSTRALARTGQVARTTVSIGDADVFVDEMLSSAADTSETVEYQEAELEGSREVADDVIDVLPDMSEVAWEAEDVGQIAADGADWAAELAGELEAELGAAKVELEQALADAQAALAAAGLARSEAAQAVADASEAAAKAAQAVQDALAASELAEGAAPSWATVDPVAADAAGKPVGAIWYVRNTAGRVVRMWELTALGWVARPFDETVIPQVAIGSGTYGTLAGDRLVAKSVTAAQIQALAITANELAANAVTAVKIAANAVTAEKIIAGAVTTDKLTALAVTAEKIAVGAIVADKIAAGAITTAKLAATAIDGMTITGALIRTAPGGRRIELSAAGLRSFSASGAETARLSAENGALGLNGDLSLIGRIVASGELSPIDTFRELVLDADGYSARRTQWVEALGQFIDQAGSATPLRVGSKVVRTDIFDRIVSVTESALTSGALSFSGAGPRGGNPYSHLVWGVPEGIRFDAPVLFQGDGSFSIVPSAGWSVYSAHDSYLTVSNGIATLRATMLISAGGSFGSILTVPPLACPGKSVFGGTFHSTGTARGQLYITPDGVLSSPASYREGALAAGGYLPVVASWRVG